MQKLVKSRGPEVDVQKCVELVGGNRFDLVIIAANKAREIKKADHKAYAAVLALLDIQNQT